MHYGVGAPNKTAAESEIIQIGNSLQPTWSIYMPSAVPDRCKAGI